MPERLEAGTLNTPGIAGLAAGIEYIRQQRMDNILRKAQGLARDFYEKVTRISGVNIYSGAPVIPIVALNIGDIDSAMVAYYLSSEYGICVRGGAHCAPLLHRAYGTEKQGMVRFSFSCFNSQEEVNAAVEAIGKISYAS